MKNKASRLPFQMPKNPDWLFHLPIFSPQIMNGSMNMRIILFSQYKGLKSDFLFNQIIRKCEALLFFWFFKNCELIRDSSLWRSNFIPSVRDSIVIIGSRSVTYTFGSRFTYKRWIRVLSKICILAFLGNYSNTVCWVSKRVNWGSHQYAS